MKFGVLYTLDVPRDVSVRQFMPTQRKLFQQTEGDEQYDYGYLEGCWEKGKHRKLVGVLNKKQFERFLEDTSLYPEDIETMGSLGVPWAGCDGLGVAPAIPFRSDDQDAIQSAYVTPLPDLEAPGEDSFDVEDRIGRYWELIKLAILSKYGYDTNRCPIAARLDKTRPMRS